MKEKDARFVAPQHSKNNRRSGEIGERGGQGNTRKHTGQGRNEGPTREKSTQGKIHSGAQKPEMGPRKMQQLQNVASRRNHKSLQKNHQRNHHAKHQGGLSVRENEKLRAFLDKLLRACVWIC